MPIDDGIGWLERLTVTFGPGGAVALVMLLVLIAAFVMRHREHRQDSQGQFKSMNTLVKENNKSIDGLKDEIIDVKGMLRRALRKNQ